MVLNGVFRKFGCVALAMTLVLSAGAAAHVRWFVSDADTLDVTLPTDLMAMMMVAAILALGFFARWITITNRLPTWVQYFCRNKVEIPHAFLWHIMAFVMCVFLLVHLLEGGFVAPNLSLPTYLQTAGVILQSLILLMVPISISLFGLGVAVLGVSLLVLFPSELAIDYLFEFFGIGFTLFLIGPTLNGLDKKWADFCALDARELRTTAIKILRICLGIQLAVLALHNKLLNPGIAAAFLDAYPIYNFFSLVPLDALTPVHFVLFVGCSELLLGVLLVFGVANRIVQLMLFAVFSLTSYVAGIEELVGHLPILAMLALLLSESTNPVLSDANNARTAVSDNVRFAAQKLKPSVMKSVMGLGRPTAMPAPQESKSLSGMDNAKGGVLTDDLFEYHWDEDAANEAEPLIPTLTHALTRGGSSPAQAHNQRSEPSEASMLLIVENWDDNSTVTGQV